MPTPKESQMIDFSWTTSTFTANADIPPDELIKNVKFMSVKFPNDTAKEVDELIELIEQDSKRMGELDAKNKERKARLDEITTKQIMSTKRNHPLINFLHDLREKWSIAMLPMTMIIFGHRYKATKSKGSVSEKPDYEKILDVLVTRHPKLSREVEELKKTVLTLKTTPSKWSNFSEIK